MKPDAGLTVAELGERGLIERLSAFFPRPAPDQGLELGVGDDAAILHGPHAGGMEVQTTDLLVEGTHFLMPPATGWFDLGAKAVAVNLSDIAAMGARPKWLMVSVALPGSALVEDVVELYRGMAAEAGQAGAAIIGGDTARAPITVLNVAATGWCEPGISAVRRCDASAGDGLYVTGTLGASLAGLRLALEPALAAYRGIGWGGDAMARHHRPRARTELGPALAAAHGPRGFAMIDVSDGLWNECHLLAEASGLVIELDLDAVPLHPAATAFAEATGADRDALRLFSGEEYELLFSSGLRSDQLPEGTRRIGSFLERGASSSAVVALRERRRVDVADATFSHYQP